MKSNADMQNILLNSLAFNTSQIIYINQIALDCHPHRNDNENAIQNAKFPLVSMVKKYFLKVANRMESLLNFIKRNFI